MLDDVKLLNQFMDSLKDPFLFADTNHIIRYMNKAAIDHYDQGEQLLNTNVLNCHNEISQKMMIDILAKMQNDGIDEQIITDNEKYRIYMRAVRNDDDVVIGYYERYEPPRST